LEWFRTRRRTEGGSPYRKKGGKMQTADTRNRVKKHTDLWRRIAAIRRLERFVTMVRNGSLVMLVTMNSSCVSTSPCPSTISLEINPQQSSIEKRRTRSDQPKVSAIMTSASFYCSKESIEYEGNNVDAVTIFITANIDYTLEKKEYLRFGDSFEGTFEMFTRNGTSIANGEFTLALNPLLEGPNKTTMSTRTQLFAETAKNVDRILIGWEYR